MKKYRIRPQAKVVHVFKLDRFDVAYSQRAYFMDLAIKRPSLEPTRDQVIRTWMWITQDVTARFMRRGIEPHLHVLDTVSTSRRKVAR